MRRRAFIILVGRAALAGLFTTAFRATAQRTAKIPRVGILSPASSEEAATLAAFRNGIRDLGYVEGQTIVLDFRVFVTDTTSATQAAASATRTILSWRQAAVIQLHWGSRRA
jgi:hypothetical protein